MVDQTLGRFLDLFGLDAGTVRRWGEPAEPSRRPLRAKPRRGRCLNPPGAAPPAPRGGRPPRGPPRPAGWPGRAPWAEPLSPPRQSTRLASAAASRSPPESDADVVAA